MNKSSFISKLKKNLKILDENEVKDIVDEYSEIIDEKIKNGKTEEEAIKDFGDVNELCKEILKAYKINPKYTDDDVKFDFENFIKNTSTKLSNFTKGLIEDVKKHDDITLDFVFEVIIKAIILLVIFAIIGLPFLVVCKLGYAIFEIAFFPLNLLLSVLWGMLIWILYFVVCVLISIRMFKDNIKQTKKAVKKNKKVKIDEEKKEENIKEKITKENKIKKDEVVNILKEIAKIFIFIFIILPLIFVNLGIVIAICFTIYYLIIGIDLLGILFILVGLLVFFGYISNQLSNLFSKKIQLKFYQVLIYIILLWIGIILSFNTFKDIKYVEYENNDVSKYNYVIENKVNLYLEGNYDIIYNEDMKDNELVIEVYYNDDFVTIDEQQSKNRIVILSTDKGFSNWYNDCINNLKDNKIVNYSKASELYFKVYGNRHTIDDINIK